MTDELPMVPVGTPADRVTAELVRSRYAEYQPPVIVIAGETTTSPVTSSRTQVVIADWKAAENLAYEILDAVSRWPEGGTDG
ncbi:hypothetical protein ACFV1L_10470 [Kitasatospora sp. NPDC059646]|uniref:hypothetical protein n=1 Tax=Kitasatospora sp. NPDC059646 TaxID=3346893 RepID=UPI0036B515EF